MAQTLPTSDMLNNIITVNNFLHTVCTTKLDPAIADDPDYSQLANDFTNWQNNLWAEYYMGLINDNIMAQAEETNQMYADNLGTQEILKTIFYASGSTPTAVSLCNNVIALIQSGDTLVTQLEEIANTLEQADQAKVNALLTLSDELNEEFFAQEDELTDTVLSSVEHLVATAVGVAVAVATEGEDLDMVLENVTKVGTDVVKELKTTDEINQTLGQLEAAWSALDAESAELANITMTSNQLKQVLDTSAATQTALNAIAADWNQIASVVTEDPDDWQTDGSDAIQAWAANISKLSFSTASQTVVTVH